MDLYVLLTVFGGSAFALFLLNKLAPGVFGSIFSALRTVMEFVVNHLPRPVQILIVIVLFLAFANTIQQYTVGLSYVCYDNNVYKVPISEGVILHSWRDLQGKPAEVSVVDKGFKDGNLYKFENESGGIVFKALAPIGVIPKEMGSKIKMSLATNQFEEIFGVKNIVFDVCWNAIDDSCVLVKRKHFYDPCACSFTGGIFDGWNGCRGTISYYVEDGDENKNASVLNLKEILTADIHENMRLGPFSYGLFDGFAVCGDSNNHSDVLGDYQMLSFERDIFSRPLLTKSKINVKLYGVDYENLLYADAYDGSKKKLFFKVPDKAINEILAKEFKNAKKVQFGDFDIFKVKCANDENDKFAVDFTVVGIPIFNKTIMVLLFVISGIIAIYKFFKVV